MELLSEARLTIPKYVCLAQTDDGLYGVYVYPNGHTLSIVWSMAGFQSYDTARAYYDGILRTDMSDWTIQDEHDFATLFSDDVRRNANHEVRP